MSQLGKAGIMAIVLALSAPGASADEALFQAIGKVLSVVPSESPGEMIEGSLVDISLGTGAATGSALSLTDDPCVVERLGVVQFPGSRPGVSMEVYDFGRIDRIRYIDHYDQLESDASFDRDDPETTMIVLEGEGWRCRKWLDLERQAFQSGCDDDMLVVNAADDQERAAALAALQVVRESCALP
jgi:hypothetical protein